MPVPFAKQTRYPGFTLVELLVVMAAISVLAAVTLPSIKGLLHDQKVTSAARMVKSHIEAAQARAISSGRRVAVIMERNANDTNVVTRLSIGQSFPPYEGDVSPTLGTLGNSGSGLFFNQITIPTASASLLVATPPVFSAGDFIQIGNSGPLYSITTIPSTGVVTFANPPLDPTGSFATQEPQLLIAGKVNTSASFRIFRRPSKSFVQTSALPRGTCIDMTVSGIGQSGNEFAATSAAPPLMIIFDPDGSIFSITDGVNPPISPTSITHLLVGRTEQVSLASPLSLEDPDNSGTFNANLNDNGNSWISINPVTGMIYSSGMQAGSESTTLATRLQVARTFATNAITQSEN